MNNQNYLNINQSLKIPICIIFLFFLSGCILQENPYTGPMALYPQPYPPEINTTISNITSEPNITITPPPQSVIQPINDKLAVYILETSVNKGTYIITLNNKSTIINAQGGADSLKIIKSIKDLGIIQADYFILTNSHFDNIAGASNIILRAKPLNVLHSGIPSTNIHYTQYTSLYPNITLIPRDTSFSFEDANIHLIVPYDDELGLTDDNTVAIKLDYGGFSILFMTDCAIDCESRISTGQADIIISNGGCDSLSLSFLKETFPELIIFTGTPCNPDKITNLGIPSLSTKKNGNILITSDGIKYEYEYEK